MVKSTSKSRDASDTTSASPGAKGEPAEVSEASYGKPTTVRFPTHLQQRLEVVADVTDKSVSQLLREGAEYIIHHYMGNDPRAVIARSTERSEARLRDLFGLDDQPTETGAQSDGRS